MADMTLYAFPTAPGFFNLSPYCTKAEVLLKLAGFDYKLEMPEDYKALPKGKLPVLKDGDRLIPDSELIRLYLADEYGKTLDDGMTAASKAAGHALCRMLDHRTNLGMIWARWVEDAGWEQTKPTFFSQAPEGFADQARATVKENMVRNGFAAFTDEERLAFFRADIAAVDEMIDDKAFFAGDHPTYVDAALFGCLANYYMSPVKTWVAPEIARHTNLVAYVERGLDLWYPAAKAALPAHAAE